MANKAVSQFQLVSGQHTPAIYVAATEPLLVQKAAQWLQQDIAAVTGHLPPVIHTLDQPYTTVIVIGTLAQSPLLKELASKKMVQFNSILNHWEAYQLQHISTPAFMPLNNMLIIAGSDKRGAAYGALELCRRIGVSPWNWWADVPAQTKDTINIPFHWKLIDSPRLQYRGIFINDEAPALSGWAHEKFGGFNHAFYEKVFELILRLKGNYLWPAMWGNAFNDDDTLNPKLADEYGIVMGTSHHEPMLRAQTEWKRYGRGAWNYATNHEVLRNFWRKGIQNMGTHESIVTIGMRGDGDEPMTEGTAIQLLENIVKDQRTIISDVTGKPAAATPQIWALYKEVQEYYDKGMRVPDDITLLLCDDNWGNIRKLPALNAQPRSGGYGIYYHFDYVGDPRNYKWLNTNPLARVWEQMHLAYEHNVKKIWLVNVGDIKPMEYPISFFMDYAWNPDAVKATDIAAYTHRWAREQFGAKYAADISKILLAYTQFNGRRKPELLSPDTYSLQNYREAETVADEYNQLVLQAERIGQQLPAACQDAFFQLVLHPVKACANLNTLYLAVAKNRLYATQQRRSTNLWANLAQQLYVNDSLITQQYNQQTAKGKWNHMMDQTHIGYTYWQQPLQNSMPEVRQIENSPAPAMGVAVEGNEQWFPNVTEKLTLPDFNTLLPDRHYIEIFNQGINSFDYTINTSHPWLQIDKPEGTVSSEQRIELTINAAAVPAGTHTVTLTITGAGKTSYVTTRVIKPRTGIVNRTGKTFLEYNGVVSIHAANYAQQLQKKPFYWQTIPYLGSTHSAVTPYPVTAMPAIHDSCPVLEYTFYTFDTTRKAEVQCYFSPTLNYHHTATGLRYAVSIDNQPYQQVGINASFTQKQWEQIVADNINKSITTHRALTPGHHTLRIKMVDAGVVLQKIVIVTGTEKATYLGPPETSIP
ncbi:hypothetical protein FLA_4944 [Filimonas lacunae]|nr:hypothetical protein FLA_4944 [Filimonas lacunae]